MGQRVYNAFEDLVIIEEMTSINYTTSLNLHPSSKWGWALCWANGTEVVEVNINLETSGDSLCLCCMAKLQGAAMGSPLSPVVANLYMEVFKQQALVKFYCKPRLWMRYVCWWRVCSLAPQGTPPQRIPWPPQQPASFHPVHYGRGVRQQACLLGCSGGEKGHHRPHFCVQKEDIYRPLSQLRVPPPPQSEERHHQVPQKQGWESLSCVGVPHWIYPYPQCIHCHNGYPDRLVRIILPGHPPPQALEAWQWMRDLPQSCCSCHTLLESQRGSNVCATPLGSEWFVGTGENERSSSESKTAHSWTRQERSCLWSALWRV